MQEQMLFLLKIIPISVAAGLVASLFLRRPATSPEVRNRQGLYRILAAVVLLGTAAIPYPKNNVQLSMQSFPTVNGNQIRLSSLVGKAAVINLWATWCGPCLREMPLIYDAQVHHPDITFVFANQGETVETVVEYLIKTRLSLKNVVLDKDRDIARMAGAAVTPTTLFFDRQGILQAMHQGTLSPDNLAKTLNGLKRQ